MARAQRPRDGLTAPSRSASPAASLVLGRVPARGPVHTIDLVLDTSADPRALLSPREGEVIDLAAMGLTNQRIAADLGVTVHAVKFHLASIYRKLGVSNRTEAVVLCLRAGDR
jgi:DNA-binding CsgD family transcriptional regulator